MAGPFDWISQLPDMYQQGRELRVQSDTRNSFKEGLPRNSDGTIDYGAAVSLAARSGNLDLMQKLAPMADAQRRDARDFAFKQEEARRAQGNTDRSYGLQEKQVNFGMQEKPSIQTVKDASGNETLVRILPTGQAGVINTGIDNTPQNPFAYPGKMTEGQAKEAGYASRMMNAEQIFNNNAVQSAALDAKQHMLSSIPFGVGNYAVSNDFQKFDQAKRDFINAKLRQESGAVISQSEFDNADKQYFPRPGDSPAVLEQKRLNRIEAIRGMAAGAGQSYSPPMMLDENGRLVPNQRNPQQQRQQRSQGQSQNQNQNIDANASLAAARAAIAGGKDRNAVIERLRQNGIDPAGL